MAEKKADPVARFIWQPGDIVLIKKGKEKKAASGKKADMPALHKQQLKLDKKSIGNQG